MVKFIRFTMICIYLQSYILLPGTYLLSIIDFNLLLSPQNLIGS